MRVALTSNDMRVVQESWIQKIGPNFGWTHLPLCRTLDARHNYGATSYRIAAVDNALRKVGSVGRWDPGDAIPASSRLKEGTVSTEPFGYAGRMFDRPIVSSDDQRNLRFRDYQFNLGPTTLVELASAIEAQLAAFLQNTTVFGTATAFTGSAAKSLADPTDWANQSPIHDIQTALQPLRWRQDLGLSLVVFMNPHVADVLSRHPAYTGAGVLAYQNAGIPGAILTDAFLAHFRAIHRIDEVIMLRAVGDTVRDGETSDPEHIAQSTATGPILTAILLDKRQAAYDLRPGKSIGGPDGALALSWAAHEVSNWVIGNRSWIEEGLKVERYRSEGSWDIFTPQYTAFADTAYGVIFRGLSAGQTMGVFDENP